MYLFEYFLQFKIKHFETIEKIWNLFNRFCWWYVFIIVKIIDLDVSLNYIKYIVKKSTANTIYTLWPTLIYTLWSGLAEGRSDVVLHYTGSGGSSLPTSPHCARPVRQTLGSGQVILFAVKELQYLLCYHKKCWQLGSHQIC